MRSLTVSPIAGLVIVLVIVSAAATIGWAFWDAADEWMTNVATDAFAIALTLAVVNKILERQARERVRPRVERAFWAHPPGGRRAQRREPSKAASAQRRASHA